MAEALQSSRSLQCVPHISFSEVEAISARMCGSSGQKERDRGYKYFAEKYVFNVRVVPNPYDDGCRATARCYKSYAKNKTPHKLEVSISAAKSISHGHCTCANDLSGHCGHVIGLLYQLAHFKMTGTDYIPVPEDIAKTSSPQTWHIPRGEKIRGEAADEMTIISFKADKQSTRAVSNTYTYNPLFGEPPSALNLVQSLEAVTNTMLSFSIGRKQTPLVDTKYGKYPKGSALASQQKLHSSFIINIMEADPFPDLPVKNRMFGLIPELPESKKELFLSLKISQTESVQIEKETRLQTNCPQWHKLRQHLITASVVADVAKRRTDFEGLSKRLKSSKTKITQAMKDWIANEPLAAEAYSKLKGNAVNLYPAGIIIHPDAFWLAASPDRKVFDNSRPQNPFGLLEIKCPSMSTKGSLEELPYLQVHNGKLQLKRNDRYYFQVQTQLAVTGLEWCDFFVWSTDAHHLETVTFEPKFWDEVKNSVDTFFFTYHL